ncbi:TetR/AcrR family transcriptional regulator [Alteromonas lipotrueiana]|uniref:TetR/AcrR family transcriptional regulator n=1 Tax=Alteromonas lipotrueiana TaxID=2803815 RepID=UPI001C46FC91|nr:TetR/AcrR family transcriptional regulator [Alteromonas lipotrueiana]
MLKQEIAAALEVAFSQLGFSEPSVAKLQKLSGVSLRTLYKYYPSKQSMIIAALEYRHIRYISFLLDNAPAPGPDAALHIFDQLKLWMQKFAPKGCLSINALAAFPEDDVINNAVQNHKNAVKHLLGEQCLNHSLANTLFLLHEGVSNAWPVMGDEAVLSAKQSILELM